MIVAHKIQLLPNKSHESYFRKACGIKRFAWNWAISEWERSFKARSPAIIDCYGDVQGYEKRKPVDDYGNALGAVNGQSLKKEFSALIDREWPWIRDVSSYAYQRVFPELEQAYQRFWKGLAEKPVKKHKGKARDSFYLANICIQVSGRHVKIQKLGTVRMRNELRFSGKIMSARISRSADKWFISIAVEIPDTQPIHSQQHVAVGVDMGIAVMAALSTGEMRENPKSLERHERKLSGLQRKLSRQIEHAKSKAGIQKGRAIPSGTKIVFSNRMLETKRRIQRAHEDISGIRSNAQHQLSAELTKRFGVIAIEDLNVKGMTASAKGTAAAPGKKVAQKSGLNRSLLNVGLGELRRQLEYKAKRTGAVLIAVNPAYTSQACSVCGAVDKDSRKSQSVFVCTSCGHTANADHNAARNIRTKGLARQAEGIEAKEVKRIGSMRPTRKKISANAESTADAAGYAQGGSSLQDRPMICERGQTAASGLLTETHSSSAHGLLPHLSGA